MKSPEGSQLNEKLSSRARMLALFLPLLSSCDSCNKTSEQAQPAASSMTTVPPSAIPVAPEPIEHPVLCMNGSLTAGKERTMQTIVRDGFEDAGATLIRVNPDNFKSSEDKCNGIVLVGGKDINTVNLPHKAPLHPKAKLMSAQRQQFDQMFYKWARQHKAPVFGECLGAQEVAVWEGSGAGLIQHIPDVSIKTNHRHQHTVRLGEPADVFGLGRNIVVKSNHHQAVKEPLPDTLKVVGRSPDNIIEAMISTDGLVWGVQWHPQHGPDQQIYRNFVKMVSEKGYRSPSFQQRAAQSKYRKNRVSSASGSETVETENTAQPGECPSDMVNVKSEFCIDRFESSLVDAVKHRVMSPYYSPSKNLLLRDFRKWSEKAGTSEKPDGSEWQGPLLDSVIKVPSPYAWQMNEDAQPMALSRHGVLPNGYLNFTLAKQACENAGKRLCTKDEWETACRGEKDEDFPYGDSYQQGQCNVFRWAHPALSLHGNAAINHHDPRLHLVEEEPGRPLLRKTGATASCVSKWGEDGVYDMVGNIDEWVDVNPPVFKGGFYSRNTKAGCGATYGVGHGRGYYDYSLGGRCCKDKD